jgi:GAF domain-containing protein
VTVDTENREKKRLEALYATGLLDSPPISAVDALVAEVAKHYGTCSSVVTLVDKQRRYILSGHNFDYTSISMDSSFNSPYLIDRDLPVIISDCTQHSIYCNAPFVLSGEIRFLAFVPFSTKEHYRIGNIAVGDPEPRDDFSLKDVDYLVDAARKLESILGI